MTSRGAIMIERVGTVRYSLQPLQSTAPLSEAGLSAVGGRRRIWVTDVGVHSASGETNRNSNKQTAAG